MHKFWWPSQKSWTLYLQLLKIFNNFDKHYFCKNRPNFCHLCIPIFPKLSKFQLNPVIFRKKISKILQKNILIPPPPLISEWNFYFGSMCLLMFAPQNLQHWTAKSSQQEWNRCRSKRFQIQNFWPKLKREKSEKWKDSKLNLQNKENTGIYSSVKINFYFPQKFLILDHCACQWAPHKISNIDKQKAANRSEIGFAPCISRSTTFDQSWKFKIHYLKCKQD